MTDRAEEFFQSYIEVFEKFDAEGIADHFTFPLHVTGESDPVDVRSVASREEWLETLQTLLELYKGFGVATAEVLDTTTTVISDRVLQVARHWSVRSGSGEEIYDFNGIYTLVDKDGGLRITAIVHDELPKIVAKL